MHFTSIRECFAKNSEDDLEFEIGSVDVYMNGFTSGLVKIHGIAPDGRTERYWVLQFFAIRREARDAVISYSSGKDNFERPGSETLSSRIGIGANGYTLHAYVTGLPRSKVHWAVVIDADLFKIED